MVQIAAIIPAAGYSSRMGFFKPLQAIGSSLQIEKPIQTMKSAGVDDIRVIVGHKKDLLYPVLSRLGVNIIENLDYDQGMFSSIQYGVSTLGENIEGFLIMPADYPYVKADTIKLLVKAFTQGKDEVIYPCYQGKRGHPPLIPNKYRSIILNSLKQDNLRILMKKNCNNYQEININDRGILRDLDTSSDYTFFGATNGLFPNQEECKQILQKEGVNGNVINHSHMVSKIALRIAEILNSAGCYLNLGLILAGSLLHDIAKGEKDHAAKGKEIIEHLGYPDVAAIVGSHMDIMIHIDDLINEAEIVYLADKLVQENRVVSLEERFTYALQSYTSDHARKAIQKRLADANVIQQKVEVKINKQLHDFLYS